MRRTLPLLFRPSSTVGEGAAPSRPPVVQIRDGTFYRRLPSPSQANEPATRPIFPGLNFALPADDAVKQYWSIIGPSNAGKTTFLEILRGDHYCLPPTARSFPYLSSDEIEAKDHRLRYPRRAIQYVGFSAKERGLSGMGTYMSARYESRRESTDFSLLDFLLGHTQLNAAEDMEERTDPNLLKRIIDDLRLADLVDMPVSNLSNGQTRRARIAKALLGKPEVLLLDEPFMGLDPPTMMTLSPLLRGLAQSSNPRLLLALRPQDPVPDWITHTLYLGRNLQITHQGPKEVVGEQLAAAAKAAQSGSSDVPEHIPRLYAEFGRQLTDQGITHGIAESSKPNDEVDEEETEGAHTDGAPAEAMMKFTSRFPPQIGEPLIEMEGVVIKYGEKTVLGGWPGSSKDQKPGLHWTVRRGQRWGVFGPNGSGKTTLLSLITSDHPQAYSAPIRVFGRQRLPMAGQPGISLFDIQARIGHSSPEVHAFFPRSLSLRATLESAYAETPLSRPRDLTAEADARIDAALRWFHDELNPNASARTASNPAHAYAAARAAQPSEGASNAEQYKSARLAQRYAATTAAAAAIEYADDTPFGSLSFSAQRVALFLRAILPQPDVVILDESFSGLDERVRDKCLLFLECGETRRLAGLPAPMLFDLDPAFYSSAPADAGPSWREKKGVVMHTPRDVRLAYGDGAALPWPTGLTDRQALVVVSHVREEVPACVRDWIYLPSAPGAGGGGGGGAAVSAKPDRNAAARVGRVEDRPLRANEEYWNRIWGLQRKHGRPAGQPM